MESARRHKKDWCELCLNLRIIDAPLDIHHHHYLTYGNEREEDVVTLCRNCHIAVEREAEKLCCKNKYRAFQRVKERLTSPKFVTVAELGLDPEQVIQSLKDLGFITDAITPTSYGVKIGFIKPIDGGFLVRKEPLI